MWKTSILSVDKWINPVERDFLYNFRLCETGGISREVAIW